jgi:hypothetical protein
MAQGNIAVMTDVTFKRTGKLLILARIKRTVASFSVRRGCSFGILLKGKPVDFYDTLGGEATAM